VTGITTTTPTNNITNPAGTAMLTGANGLTVNGAGSLVLVTPIKVMTNIAGNLAAFSTLTLNYVGPVIPEPGTLLLLGRRHRGPHDHRATKELKPARVV